MFASSSTNFSRYLLKDVAPCITLHINSFSVLKTRRYKMANIDEVHCPCPTLSSKLDAILTDPNDIVGEIYVMTNVKSNMAYVGQAVSHRLNHGKYRPHGSKWRFKEHIGEAVRNMKNKVGCVYLNNAIREDGADAFVLEVIHWCPVAELDKWEAHFIAARGTLYPNGYNLRAGGARAAIVKHDVQVNAPITEPRAHGGRTAPHREATKELTSRRLKELHATGALVEKYSNRAKAQHNACRQETFADVAHLLDAADCNDDLAKYIKKRKSKTDGSFVCIIVKLGGKITKFWPQRQGPSDNVEGLWQEALDFLTELKVNREEKREKKQEE